MSRVAILTDQMINADTYNDKVLHPLQSWEWGEAQSKMGIDILRVGEWEKKELINVFLIIFQKIPYTKYQIAFILRSKIPSPEVLLFLKEECQKKNCIFIRLSPELFKSDNHIIDQYRDILSPGPPIDDHTFKIDITISEEELLYSMNQTTRYNTRRATKKGVYVREKTNKLGFNIFTKIYFDTCKRKNYYGHNYAYHSIIFETLKKKYSHILIAYYQGIPLAACHCFKFKETLHYVYSGTSVQFQKVAAANLLVWEAIRLGKKLGAKSFDMGSCIESSDINSHPWAGFSQFKIGYGGKINEFIGLYDLVIDRILYNQYLFYNVTAGKYRFIITSRS